MGIPYAEVIGDPVAQSKSPLIHKFWLEKLGIEGDYRATRVDAAELPGYLAERRRDPDWRGCNVTMPHKQSILPLLDEVCDFGVGAVNCVTPFNGGLRGLNTDSSGVDEAIDHWRLTVDQRICLIGAGGAARAAIASLNIYCLDTFDVIARDAAKARALLEGCGVNGEIHAFEDAEMAMTGRYAAINASPLGMAGFPPMPQTIFEGLSALGAKRLLGNRRRGFALDMVTSPVRTPFIEHAGRVGLTVSDGLTMLIGQARAAFHAFFGQFPPPGESELRERLTS